jgi:hypothetical protein
MLDDDTVRTAELDVYRAPTFAVLAVLLQCCRAVEGAIRSSGKP